MPWLPVVSDDVEKVAAPPARATMARVAPFSRKVTDPVAAGPPPLTVAVNVTDWPYNDGLGPDGRDVAVATLPTCWLTAADVLPVKVASPPYWAVVAWTPAASDDVV